MIVCDFGIFYASEGFKHNKKNPKLSNYIIDVNIKCTHLLLNAVLYYFLSRFFPLVLLYTWKGEGFIF